MLTKSIFYFFLSIKLLKSAQVLEGTGTIWVAHTKSTSLQGGREPRSAACF